MSESEPVTSHERATQARCIAVRIGTALYGLPVADVQEVIGVRMVTRVFHAPNALAGVTNLRGEVLPVLELSILLGGEALSPTADSRIVVVREQSGLKRRAGLRVDELRGLRNVPETLAPAPATASESAKGAIVGIIAEPPPCAVLSVPALLDSPVLEALAGGRE
jgi:purine-binding chemotaxis protein CheW